MSLASLKTAGIQLDAEEAVAVGRALCRTLMAARVLRAVIPDSGPTTSAQLTSSTVCINADGRISVAADDLSDVPALIQSLGRILSDILPEPRPLLETAIISKARSSPPQFGTLNEVLDAWVVPERPNRKKVIQALYERAEERITPATTAMHSIAPRPTPPLVWSTNPAGAAARRQRYQVVAVAGLVIVAVAVVAISGWFLLTRWQAGTPRVTAQDAPSPEPVPAKARGKTARTDSPSRTARAASSAVSPTAVPQSTARSSVTTGKEPVTVGEADPPPVSRASDNAAASSTSVGNPRPEPTGVSVTYGENDADVMPPTPILPELLGILKPSSYPGVRLDALTIAVVVNPDGTVDSVKGVNTPQNMGELVLLTTALSAVKSLRFTPATKDGVPVRYRSILPLRMFTRPGS